MEQLLASLISNSPILGVFMLLNYWYENNRRTERDKFQEERESQRAEHAKNMERFQETIKNITTGFTQAVDRIEQSHALVMERVENSHAQQVEKLVVSFTTSLHEKDLTIKQIVDAYLTENSKKKDVK